MPYDWSQYDEDAAKLGIEKPKASKPSTVSPGKPRMNWGEQLGQGMAKGMMEVVTDFGEMFDWFTGYKWRAPTKMFLDGMSYDEMVDDVEKERESVRRELEESGGALEDVAKGVTEFLSYFIPAGSALNIMKVGQKGMQVLGIGGMKGFAGGLAVEAEIAGLIAENMAFAPDEERLSNLVERVPVLRNPITDYLKAEEGDVGVEARLKQNIEALGLGLLGTPLFAGINAARQAGLKKLGDTIALKQIEKEEEIHKQLLADGLMGRDPVGAKYDEAIFRRGRRLFKDDVRAIKEVARVQVDDLRQSVLFGYIDKDEAIEKMDKMFGEIDPGGKVFPESVRDQLKERVRKPKKEKTTKSANAVFDLYRQGEEVAKERSKKTLKRYMHQAKRGFVDQSGNVKAALLKEAGPLGEEAVMRFELVAGANTKSDLEFQKWRGQIYSKVGENKGSMDKVDVELLDKMINFRRGYEIASSKPQSSPWVEGATGREQIDAEAYLNGLEVMRREIGAQKYSTLARRANLYFDAMKEQLRKLESEGLISEEELKVLQRFDYQPRVMLQLVDPVDKVNIGGKSISVKSSGIEPLGRAGEVALEHDSKLLLAQVIARTNGRIAKNRATAALGDAAKAMDPGNGFLHNKKFPGATELSYREGGKLKKVYMDGELAKEWVTKAPILGEMWSKITGTDLVRTLATGINPEFALVNFPRDLAYIYLTTNEFSPHLPVAIAQMARNLGDVAEDALKRKGKYEQFINEGGGMSFLTHGAAKEKQVLKEGKWQKTKDVLSYVTETSEVLTRLMVQERALQRGASAEEAAWAARKYIDFSQGGNGIKVADTFIPYLNASVQGLRGIGKAIKERPVQTGYKIAQFGAASGMLWLYNELNHPEVMSQISPEEKARFWIVPTGMSYIDTHGNERHVYNRVAVEHSLIPFKSAFDAVMARGLKGEIPTDEALAGIKEGFGIVGDVSAASPPVAKFVMQYMWNRQFYTDSEIWKGPDVEPMQEIGRFPNSATSQMAIDFTSAVNKTTGIELSPSRIEGSIGAILPRNVFTTYGNKVYENLREGNEYQALKHKVTTETILDQPFIRRLMSETHPLASSEKMIDQLSREAEGEEKEYTDEVYKLATLAYNEGKDYSGELKDVVMGAPPMARQRLVERYKRVLWSRKATEQLEGVDYYQARNPTWWLSVSGAPPRARAELVYEAWRGTPPDKRGKLWSFAGAFPNFRNREFLMRFNELKKDRGSGFP